MNILGFDILSVLIFLPVIGVLLIIMISKEKPNVVKGVTFITALVNFLISLLLFRDFDATTHEFQFTTAVPWIQEYGIYYRLGLDGISLFLVLLTTFLTALSIIACWKDIQEKVKGFMMCILFLETGVIGVFVSLDLFLFYIFWEVMLLPMYLLIGVWGSPARRIYAAVKFFLYTMFGSLLMMVAIISYRENLFGVALIFSPVVDAASVLFPPIQDIPKVIRSKGFGERGTIIQVVASIGINAALATAGVVGYLRANGLTRLNKEASSVSSSWLSIASIATVGFAYSCTWFLFWPSNNYNQKGAIMFDGFTTSDLSLLFRFWFWPTAIFVLTAMALATVVRRIRFGRYDEYNKYKEG